MGFRRPPIPPRRAEGIRYIRSDGKPEFTTRVHEKPGDLMLLAKRPVVTSTPTTPLSDTMKIMVSTGRRRVPIVTADMSLVGIVVATDIVNYFGGGEYYNILINKHGRNFLSAINEPTSTIMTRDVIYAYVDEKITDALERMLKYDIGALPILTKDNKLYGMITERDIVNYLMEKHIGVKVSDIMSTNVVSVNIDATLGYTAKLMIKYGFRRLPVVRQQYVEGIVTTMDIVKNFITGKILEYAPSGLMNDILNVKIKTIMTSRVITIEPDADIGDAATKMINENVGALLVVEDNLLKGIITERDILLALSIKR